jgi:hypothetical protein
LNTYAANTEDCMTKCGYTTKYSTGLQIAEDPHIFRIYLQKSNDTNIESPNPSPRTHRFQMEIGNELPTVPISSVMRNLTLVPEKVKTGRNH